MSDKVIVSKQDANDLPYVEQEHSGDKYVLLEDIKHWLDQATPVSGEAVAMINFNEHEEYICMPVGREVFKLAPDVDHLLYTTPQPAIPEGYALVPIEPTEAMVINAINTFGGVMGTPKNLANPEYVNRMLERQKKAVIGHYKAMIAEAMKGE